MTPQTQDFFRTLHPASAAAVMLALAGGTPLQVDRLPVDALPAVVLLATCGLRVYEQQIVDDYPALLRRMEHIMQHADITRRVQAVDDTDPHAATHNAQDAGQRYDHVLLHLVTQIVLEGPRAPYFLDSMPEAACLPHVYEELVNADLHSLIGDIVTGNAGKTKLPRHTPKENRK